MQTANRVLLCLLLSLLGCVVMGQRVQTVLKVSPGKLITRGLDVSAEYAFAKPFSATLGVQYTLPWEVTTFAENIGVNLQTDLFTVDQARLTGYKVTPTVRYYFFNEAPAGGYLEGLIRFMNYKLSTSGEINTRAGAFGGDVSYRMQGIGPGLSVGIQKIWDSGFVLDWHIGGAVSFNGLRVNGQFSGAGADALQDILNEINLQLDQIPLINPPDLDVINDEFSVRLARVAWPVFRTSLSVGIGI